MTLLQYSKWKFPVYWQLLLLLSELLVLIISVGHGFSLGSCTICGMSFVYELWLNHQREKHPFDIKYCSVVWCMFEILFMRCYNPPHYFTQAHHLWPHCLGCLPCVPTSWQQRPHIGPSGPIPHLWPWSAPSGPWLLHQTCLRTPSHHSYWKSIASQCRQTIPDLRIISLMVQKAKM